MSALDSDLGFEGVLRRAAAAAEFGARTRQNAGVNVDDKRPARSDGVTAFSVFAGLGIISAVIFATGYSALLSETPAIWIHRLMALTVAQSIIIAGVALKLLPLIERQRFSVRIFPAFSAPGMRLLEEPATVNEPMPAPPRLPRKPVVGGKLAGREFLEHEDGSIEIDTLVGRRRFVSLEAAREFVGA
jgi:hypothetical protein